MTQEQRILCKMLAEVLFGRAFLPQEEINWINVLEESRVQTVVIPAFLGWKKWPLPDAEADKVRELVRRYTVLSVQRYGHHDELHRMMEEADIPYCVLKGVASAWYYPEQMIRQIGDVDFLVAPEDVERASEVLIQHGYKPWDQEHICHIVFRKEGRHLELHFEPAGVPEGEAGNRVRRALEDIFDTAHKVSVDSFTYVLPDAFHHALIMLIHMQHHLLAEGIGLRHLCDWAVFVGHFPEGEFESRFRPSLEEVGLWQFACVLSHTASLYLGLSYENWMKTDENLAAALMEDILSGGDFGVKDEQRVYEGMFISNRGKNGLEHNRLMQFMQVLNGVVYTHWPRSRRWKVLLPFGWLYFCLLRMVRMARKERAKIHIAAAYQKSDRRKKLYQELHLFERKNEKE